MKKFIMFFTLILSFIAIIGVTLFFGRVIEIMQILNIFGNFTIDIPTIISLFETDFEEGLYSIGILTWGVLQIYGIPLIIFLVSLNGLTSK
jgi:hypothetical protein